MKHPAIPALCLSMALFTSTGSRAADFTNSIGMEFNTIPAGSFYMGSCKLTSDDEAENKKRQFMGLAARGAACPSGAGSDNEASDHEAPQHLVQISKSFQMGVHEVTLGQFKQFIANAGRTDLLDDRFMKRNNQGGKAAVVNVSWNDAQDFISWLNQQEGGNRYRLPTEAEWEYAARGGTTSAYSFHGTYDDYAWYEANSGGHQHPVGQLRPNPYGLYDMHGNVWEWTQDYYDANYYRNSPTSDPQGPKSGEWRVFRGGSWGNIPWSLRSAFRGDYGEPGFRISDGGFRLSRM